MNTALIIGSGISGLYSAINVARSGNRAILVSPYISERSQSIMAAGGINGVLNTMGENDSIELHVEETLKGGCYIANKAAVEGLCGSAPELLADMARMGVLFSRDNRGEIIQRKFGGQTKKRTAYAGTSTGKQLVTALVREARKYEAQGLIERRYGENFLSALIKDSSCYGAVLYDELKNSVQSVSADAVILATGGQNLLFGKTTGSTLCDGCAAAKIFTQGARLKNLEFIQYHPTTLETPRKRMLISEAARGEGGRLFYYDGKDKLYFMEELFGPNGNLMPRDVVAKAIYDVPAQVYLDVSFLDKQIIHERLEEIYDVCMKYAEIDITKVPIPVYPSVHFFMGGLEVDNNHQTCIDRLYAVGECASIYHGANRLGGNSLLAALYSAKVAANHSMSRSCHSRIPDFTAAIKAEQAHFHSVTESKSLYPAVYILEEIARIMNADLGITRNETKLKTGLDEIAFYIDALKALKFDGTISPYLNYGLQDMFTLAKAILTSALARQESRGAHIREDYPNRDAAYECATVAAYYGGKIDVEFRKEGDR